MRAEAFRTDLFANAVIITNDKQQTNLSKLTDKNIRTFWAAKSGKDVQLTFTVRGEQRFNALSLEEMIDYGQRVIAFSIEYWNNGQFEKIFSGTTIGRKKIASFNTIKTDRIRITIHETKAPVVLRSVSAYHIKNIP